MIEMFINGVSGKNSKSFAVILRKEPHVFEKSFDISEDLSSNKAELMALDYALKAVKSDFRDEEVCIFTVSTYVPRMFEMDEDGFWVSDPKKNAEIIESIRGQLTLFDHVSIEVDKSHPMIKRAKGLARE